MARTRGSHDIAPKIRWAFLKAMQMSEDEGLPIEMIIKNCLKNSPIETLNAISKFVPREMLIEQTLEVTIEQMSDKVIQSEIDRLISQGAALDAARGKAEATWEGAESLCALPKTTGLSS